MKIKALIAGVVLAMGAGSANAAISSPVPGPGELFLSVFDPSQEKSYHQDLNIDMFRFLTDPSYQYHNSKTWSIPLNNVWNGFYSGGEAGDMVWNVAAADGNPGKLQVSDPTYGYVATMIQATTSPAPGDVTNVRDPIAVIGNKTVAYNAAGADAAIWVKGTAGYFPLDWGTDFAGTVPTDQTNATLLGGDLNLWLHGILPSPGEDEEGNPLPQLGRFEKMPNFLTLTATSLDYKPVPVPAAVWLFGSALAGLAGFGARRRSRA